MFTTNSFLREFNNLSTHEQEEIYALVHKLNDDKRKRKNVKKILSFAGSFNDMTDSDWKDFTANLKSTRDNLLER
jgi:hypothetical protein